MRGAERASMASSKTQSNGKVRKADATRGNAAAAPGARLAAAFEAVERFPALIESRARVMQAATAETARIGELVEAVEADVALTVAVLRFANRTSGSDSVGTAPVFDFFESNGGWELRPEQFRVHALATQQAAARIGREIGWEDRDELVVAALLHDIGRLVISKLHPGRRTYFDAAVRTPEQRL